MKTYTNNWLAVLVCGLLSTSGLVLAEQPETPDGWAAGSTETRSAHRGEWAEFLDFKLEKLHSELGLNSAQEAGWVEWLGRIKPNQAELKNRGKDIHAWRSLPVPERMEKMLELAKNRVVKLEEHLAATKTFYAILTPQQQQLFDRDFNFGPGGHGGRHR
jgi:hypothetical protein